MSRRTGYATAFGWGAALVLFAGVATAVLVKVRAEDLPANGGPTV